MHGLILIILLVAGLGGGYFLGIASLLLFPFVMLSIAFYYLYVLLFHREKIQKYLFELGEISEFDFLGQENTPAKLSNKPINVKKEIDRHGGLDLT